MEKHSDNFRTLCSSHTDLNADSVEWCPHEPNQNVFVCANYQLVEQSEVIFFSSILSSTLVLFYRMLCQKGLEKFYFLPIQRRKI